MLMFADNLPQTAPDAIANYRASEAARGDETGATLAGIIDCCYTER